MKNSSGGREKKSKKQLEKPIEAEVCEIDKEVEAVETVENNIDFGENTENLYEKIEELEQKLKSKDDEILRRAADIDNYRKRLQKEADDRAKYANQGVVMDFLGVLDNIELSLQYTEEGSQLRQGLELTIKSFKDVLAKHGVKEIDASNGIKFNPVYHEGMMISSDPDYLNDAITMCVQKGYILNDRVIRPAKVRVNKN